MVVGGIAAIGIALAIDAIRTTIMAIRITTLTTAAHTTGTDGDLPLRSPSAAVATGVAVTAFTGVAVLLVDGDFMEAAVVGKQSIPGNNKQ